MRAKSAVIIRVASNFLRLCGRQPLCTSSSGACVATCAPTEAERRACAASGDGATYLTHGVVHNLSRVYTFYLADRGPDRAAWLGSVAVRGGCSVQRPGTGRLVSCLRLSS